MRLTLALSALALVLAAPFAAVASKTVDVKIDGMTCDHCAGAVKEKLSQIPNIDKSKVQIVLKESKATLDVQEADAATMEAIKKAVKDAGFTVAGEPTVVEPKAAQPKAKAPKKKS